MWPINPNQISYPQDSQTTRSSSANPSARPAAAQQSHEESVSQAGSSAAGANASNQPAMAYTGTPPRIAAAQHPSLSGHVSTQHSTGANTTDHRSKRRRLGPEGQELTIRTSPDKTPRPRRSSSPLFVSPNSPAADTELPDAGQPTLAGIRQRSLSSPLSSPPDTEMSDADAPPEFSEQTLESWRRELLGALQVSQDAHTEKLKELGLTKAGGSHLTDSGSYAAAFYKARSGQQFAEHVMQKADITLTKAGERMPQAVAHGKRIPGSPSRELAGIELQAELDRVKGEAIEPLTDQKAQLVLDGYLDPLKGKLLTHKGRERIFQRKAKGDSTEDIRQFLGGMAAANINKMIRQNPEAVDKYRSNPDPYAARAEIEFPPSIVALGDRLHQEYQAEVAQAQAENRNEEELSGDEDAYKTAKGNTHYLNERGRERAKRMIKMTTLSLDKIGGKFGMKKLVTLERGMLPHEDVGKLSAEDQGLLAWYLIGKVGGDPQQITGITGIRRPDVTRMLGVAPTGRHKVTDSRMLDETEEHVADVHQLHSFRTITLETGIGKSDLSVGNRRYLLRNLKNEDGTFSDLAKNFFLARMFKNPPQSAEELLGIFQVSQEEKLQELLDLKESAASDIFLTDRWGAGQYVLTPAQKDEIRDRALRGQHLTYIRHHFADIG